jgi:ubiquinone/menaquinone biosynthesis C-methylase UbiE
MGFYTRHILPHLIRSACGLPLVRRQRERVVPLASGEVVEIGIGSGPNLPLYDPTRVTRVIGIDPSEPLLGYARRAAIGAAFPVELRAASAERLPIASSSTDTAVLTFTLCSIPDAASALAEIRRVLRRGGSLLFLEHGLAPDEAVRRWQHRLDPLWGPLAGGCHLSRDIPALLSAAGFHAVELDTGYLRGAPRFAGYLYRGVASAH